MEGNYFEDLKNQTGKNKVLLGIIGGLLIVNLIVFKGLLDVASNKTVVFQVPNYLEPGEYVIGSTFANQNIFKMWSKVWITEIANFSYKDVREKVGSIMEFLAPETAYKNKSQLLKFIDFIEANFITQSFAPDNYDIKEMAKKGFYSISWEGTLKRTIGTKNDPVSNIKYKYEFICYVKNGQIYIHSLKTDVADFNEGNNRKILKENEFINYEVYEPVKAKKEEKKNETK